MAPEFKTGDRVEAEWTPSKPSRWAEATIMGMTDQQKYRVLFSAAPDKERIRRPQYVRALPEKAVAASVPAVAAQTPEAVVGKAHAGKAEAPSAVAANAGTPTVAATESDSAEASQAFAASDETSHPLQAFEVAGYTGMEADFVNARYEADSTREKAVTVFRNSKSKDVWAYEDNEGRWRIGHSLDFLQRLGGDYGYLRSVDSRSGGEMPWEMGKWEENRGAEGMWQPAQLDLRSTGIEATAAQMALSASRPVHGEGEAFVISMYGGLESDYINAQYDAEGVDDWGEVLWRSTKSEEVWAYKDDEQRWRIGHTLDMGQRLGSNCGYLRSAPQVDARMPWEVQEWEHHNSAGSWEAAQLEVKRTLTAAARCELQAATKAQEEVEARFTASEAAKATQLEQAAAAEAEQKAPAAEAERDLSRETAAATLPSNAATAPNGVGRFFKVGDKIEAEWVPSKPCKWASGTVVDINPDGGYTEPP